MKGEETMSIKAYILANVEVGMGEEVFEALSAIEGITSVHNVTGPYDVIAQVEVTDTAALGELVVSEIQLIDGIDYTLTCVVM
jgi:DNA-binding Lrp family transcriptional regulator